jgi:hypothetical protein
MWAGSFGLVAAVVVAVALALVLGIFLASPLFAIAIFIVFFPAFLVWRGKRRSEAERGSYGSRVPRTEETAADPVADSSIPDVARTRTDART